MILQALNQLYERLESDHRYGMPTPGYSVQKVTFCIVVKADGSLHDIEDARETVTETNKSGKTKSRQVSRQVLVPGEGARSGQGFKPFILCDNTGYLLGYKKPDADPVKAQKEADRSAKSFITSRDHHLSLESSINDPAYSAVCEFLKGWLPEHASEFTDKLDDFAATGFGVFRVLPDTGYVHERAAFKVWWSQQQQKALSSDVIAPCLVTGETLPIARLAEPALKGVNGAAPGGAKLASFNLNAFESYGKEQTYNAPVSEKATFRYCNALNALLGGKQSHRHRIVIGDATTVFWTERESATESIFAAFLSGDAQSPGHGAMEEDPLLHTRIDSFLKILRSGGGTDVAELGDDPSTKFYVLGLSGNVTRLSVRFWHIGSVAQMVDRLKSHFDALRIRTSRDHDPEFPPLWALLRQTARESKDIPPLLSGVFMQSILNGTRYPQALYAAVLNRIRADRTVNYLRASIIKAILTRNFNASISMSLDPDRTDPAYLLGRLFAALEKTQEDALPGINATIRDRFYSSASATPGSVFPRILRTYQHHLAKINGGMKVNRERLVQSIHGPLESYPAHLNIEEQGLFAIGYYHQRQDLFTKKAGSDDVSSAA